VYFVYFVVDNPPPGARVLDGVNQSQVEIGCLLDSLPANHRRTTSLADHPFE
jgi:hypothetical protein